MRLRNIIFIWVGFVLLTGCGDAQVLDVMVLKNSKQDSAVLETTQVESIPVDTGPFEPPTPWDFHRGGRPENTFTLTFSRDENVCSEIIRELNKPLISTSIRGGWHGHERFGNTLFGSTITAKWQKLISGDTRVNSYRYVIADLDHDSVPEYILKRIEADRIVNLLQDKLKYASVRPIVSEGAATDSSIADLHTELFTSDFSRKRTAYFWRNNVDTMGAAELPQMYNGMNTSIGLYVRIVRAQNNDYILLGGMVSRPQVSRLYVPSVRVLAKGVFETGESIRPYYTYRLICELRQNYYDSENALPKSQE